MDTNVHCGRANGSSKTSGTFGSVPRLDAQVNENPGMLERDGEPAAKRAKARDRNTWDTIIVMLKKYSLKAWLFSKKKRFFLFPF